MPTVLIRLPEGQGVVRRDDGTIVITHDVNDDRGQPLWGRDDYRPTSVWLDDARSIVAGLLPPHAVTVEIVDDRRIRVAAATSDGVYAGIIQQPNDGREPIVCCRDDSGAPVTRPLPADWARTQVSDAQEPCPACGAIDYDEVLPTDESRGGSGGHGDDGPLEPCRIVVCRRCGHEEGAGSGLIRFTSPGDEDETAKATRIARYHAEVRVRNWHSDAMTLRGATFPIYAVEGWPARITGSGSSGDDLTKITIGHHAEQTDDPFRRADLTVTTEIDQRHDSELRRAQHALEAWVYDDNDRPLPDGSSDAATKLWFAARRRERHGAALDASPDERLITIDGSPEPFLRLSTPTGRWVAIRRHDNLTITIAARNLDPATLTLEPIPDPAARLLGPQPPEPSDPPA